MEIVSIAPPNLTWSKELEYQRLLITRALSSFAIRDETPTPLTNYLGEVITFPSILLGITPKLLGRVACGHGWHLVPLWQIVKFLNVYPSIGEPFQMTAVVGVKKVVDQNGAVLFYAPACRLPRS